MINKKRILFVDDDQDILKLIRAKLRAKIDAWEVDFVDDALTAINKMVNERYDAVVSDIEMPEMSGVELLDEIKERYPHTVRILHSGQTNNEVSLKSIESSHQYLKKPWGVKELTSTLQRAFALQDLLNNKKMQELVTKQGSLPSLPVSYTQLMDEIETNEPNIAKIGAIISSDVSMTANILKLANSAYFGLRTHVSDPAQAVKYLGLNLIRSLFLTYSVFSKFSEAQIEGIDINSLLEHSTTVGGFAKTIAKAECQNDTVLTDALIAGMLHDVGKLILMLNIPHEYGELIQTAKSKNEILWQCEQKTLGFTHAEVGAYLLGIWGLPDPIVEAVGFHHRPHLLFDFEFKPLTAVHAANAIWHEINEEQNKENLKSVIKYFETLGLSSRVDFWHTHCSKLADL